MYQVIFYGEELGDMESAVPAETFADGVACVVNGLGHMTNLTVETETKDNGSLVLRVLKGDTTLAIVSDELPAEPADGVPGVTEACNALAKGDARLLKALFKAK